MWNEAIPSPNELANSHAEYPYVVIRHFAATYERRPVRFVEHRAHATTPGGALLVPVDPSELGAAATRRAALVQRLVELARSTTRRTCAVFGPDDAVYVEPAGETKASSDIPRQGPAGS